LLGIRFLLSANLALLTPHESDAEKHDDAQNPGRTFENEKV